MRYEWTDPKTGVRWAADDATGLPISATCLAFLVSAREGWQPDGSPEAAREILRLAARVRELESGLADQGRIYFLHGPAEQHEEQAIRAMRKHGQREAALTRLAKLDALLASERPPFAAPAVERDAPLDPQARGGHTYIHDGGGKYLFRLSIDDGESQIDLLRMAYNSGIDEGAAAAWRWFRDQLHAG